jgi:four helix bundle protein
VVVDLNVNVNVNVDLDGNGNLDLVAPSLTPPPTDLATSSTCRPIGSWMLTFQRLDVYQRALEFLALVCEVVGDLPRGHGERADQLVRAAESVVRNIAEGAGRWSEADAAKHYKIARGEAMECAASLDVMKLRQLIDEARYERGMSLLQSVVAMLTKMF